LILILVDEHCAGSVGGPVTCENGDAVDLHPAESFVIFRTNSIYLGSAINDRYGAEIIGIVEPALVLRTNAFWLTYDEDVGRKIVCRSDHKISRLPFPVDVYLQELRHRSALTLDDSQGTPFGRLVGLMTKCRCRKRAQVSLMIAYLTSSASPLSSLGTDQSCDGGEPCRPGFDRT